MKNLIYLIITVVAISIVSCEQKNEVKITEPSIEKFSNDERVLIVVNSFEKIIEQSPYDKDFDAKSFRNHTNTIEMYVNQIFDEYGKENVIQYCHKLSENEHTMKDNCCDRNADGTTNWDCCNIWTGFLAAAGSAIKCDSSGNTEVYYDCVQERVYKNC